MADRVLPGPLDGSVSANEAVCIHTRKIIDSCRDKDCIEDLRVFPFASSVPALESACGIRPRSARILDVEVSTEEIAFNRGYYTIDLTFYYEVTGETIPANTTVQGIAVFSKRCMLYGGEGSAVVYTSNGEGASVSPIAAVEVVDPITLGTRLVDCACPTEAGCVTIPQELLDTLPEPLQTGDLSRIWLATLGQFSMLRLERDTQLVIPMYDYCVPQKECIGADEDDPCTLFSRIDFPVNEFYPPSCGCDD